MSLTNIRQAHPETADAMDTSATSWSARPPTAALVFPAQFVIADRAGGVIGFFLHRTAYGRYWYAIGHNELAAKYAGVNVDRQRIVVYVICSTLAAFAGVLLLLDYSTLQADNAGTGMELVRDPGAVLGGCSLRGGEGTAVGHGARGDGDAGAENLITVNGLGSDVIPVIVGLTLLFGTIVDEFIRRRSRLKH